jgi:hypothetical protein
MSLEQSAVATFANHQTFHPRFGWIKKGFDAAASDAGVFNDPEAPVRLGVGKNMVEAIRFWCLATRVLERQPDPVRPRMSVAVPTRFGEAVLGSKGLDPWIEDPTTLWLLHWQAVTAETLLPIWWSTFNDFTALEFTELELRNFCIDEVANTTWSQPNPSSIVKDVDCLLRMYTSRTLRGRQTIDDLLDSPFRELGVIAPAPSSTEAYRFVRGAKPTLAPAAIAYACLDYMARTDPGARTASMTRLTADPGSPGRMFKVGEDVVLAALEWARDAVTGLELASPAGTTQLVIDAAPEHVAQAVLLAHHRLRGIEPIGVGVVAGEGAREADPRAAQKALKAHSTRGAA